MSVRLGPELPDELFNLMNGLIAPDNGEVLFKGERISGKPPNRICASGISRTMVPAWLTGSKAAIRETPWGASTEDPMNPRQRAPHAGTLFPLAPALLACNAGAAALSVSIGPLSISLVLFITAGS